MKTKKIKKQLLCTLIGLSMLTACQPFSHLFNQQPDNKIALLKALGSENQQSNKANALLTQQSLQASEQKKAEYDVPLSVADIEPVAKPALKHLTHIDAQQKMVLPDTQITDLMQSGELNQLIQQALKTNVDIQQSKLALQIAYKNLDITLANELPSANLGLDASRIKNNSKTNYNAKINASWELDIWRQLETQSVIAQAQTLAGKMQLQAAKDALVANIMRQYVLIAKNKHELYLQQQRVKKLQHIQHIVTKRFRRGLVALTDLTSARANTEQAKARLPEFKQNLDASKNNLMMMLGVLSPNKKNQLKNLRFDYPSVALPISALNETEKPQVNKTFDLRRRPDLQQAFYNIRVAELQVDVAYKQLLPRFSLSGELSKAVTNPVKFFSDDPAWRLLGQLTAPLFNAGKIKNQANVASLKSAQQFWAFQKILLSAYTNINTAQQNENALILRKKQLQLAKKQKQLASTSTATQYRMGNADLLSWYQHEMSIYDMQQQLSGLLYAQLINRINLGLELGLGVYHKPKVELRYLKKPTEQSQKQ